MTTTKPGWCSIGGCDQPGHVLPCGCHQYGWLLCARGRQLQQDVKAAQANTVQRRSDQDRALKAAKRAYAKHNPTPKEARDA